MADTLVDLTPGPLPDADAPLPADAAPDAPGTDVVLLAPEAAEGDKLPAQAALQADGGVLLTLRFPVVLRFQSSATSQVREERHDTLHMSRLTGGDMRAVMNAGGGNGITVGIAKSCRMPLAKFNAFYDRMDGADAMAAAAVLNYFLSDGTSAAGGPPSSP